MASAVEKAVVVMENEAVGLRDDFKEYVLEALRIANDFLRSLNELPNQELVPRAVGMIDNINVACNVVLFCYFFSAFLSPTSSARSAQETISFLTCSTTS